MDAGVQVSGIEGTFEVLLTSFGWRTIGVSAFRNTEAFLEVGGLPSRKRNGIPGLAAIASVSGA